MAKLPAKLWQEMTTTDFAELDRERVVAVLPVGAIEQHGPHLPVAVDACINQGIIDEVLRRLPATFLPLMPIGKSNEHQTFPGTLTLSAETVIRLWTETGESVARAGIRRLVIANSHGGQPQIMDIVARDLRVRLGMLVVTMGYGALGRPPGLFPESELRHGIHGGSSETAMMLHLRPDLVRDGERRDFVPLSLEMECQWVHLRPEGRIGFGWQTQDLNPQGACGNALDADAERGRLMIEYAAERFIELLREVERFPLSKLRPGPLDDQATTREGQAMLVTKQPVLRRFWYPVMPSSRLDDEPAPFTLLGTDIVLWRSEMGEPACFRDRCCHRTAKLSLGFVDGDRLVCGYHGWSYRADGVCVRIPQRENPENVAGVRVPAYRVAERYGYLWVALDEPLTDIPDVPEASQHGFRQVDQFYEPWNIAAFRLMENSFDAAHIAFVHRKTFGNVERPRTDGHRDIKTTAYGFEAVNESRVKVRGDVAQRAVDTSSEDTVRRTHNTWYMPFARRLAIHYPHGLIHTIVTCATPMTDRTAMILQWVYRNDTKEQVSSADVVAFDRAVTLEDKRVLESCDADVPLADTDGEEMHMRTDYPGVVMRRMFAKLLADHGETEQRAGA